jgi:predicted nucleic acid-binding protein
LSVYADTSFLVSLYVLDANSALAAARMKQIQLPLLLSSLGELELTNAIGLRLYRKEIRPAVAKSSLILLQKDLEDGVLLVKPLPAAAFERAKQISRKHTPKLGTRSIDTLHVAAAIVLQAGSFLTFDKRQAHLAAAAGLRVL